MKSEESNTKKQIADLLYQALETELGGVEIYRLAILCARNDDLREEWIKYLAQTERHVEILRKAFGAMGMDPAATTPGRLVVRDKGKALLSAMQRALRDAPMAAQVVACECVVDAETKDHSNWEMIGALSSRLSGASKKALAEAYQQVEDEEDEHLYHSKGWCRELWLDSLGLPAELPPPEEKRDVKSAAEAARAAEQRKANVKRSGDALRREARR